ncbi:MAG: hypothetical protein AAGB19_02690 [Cyanobacteria bacterium P01_F01_bin.3]
MDIFALMRLCAQCSQFSAFDLPPENGDMMKYFFLSDSWTTGRVWEFGGLWNEQAWNRKPYLQKQPLYIQENDENLWLYKTEEAVLMVEVMPKAMTQPTIGQVVLKRLLSAEQVVDMLCKEDVFHPRDLKAAVPSLNESEAISV